MSVRKEKKAETRQMLMTAAIQVFHEKGIHAARISDIVARAGVAQGTFYYHFASKQAVFNQIADDYLDHYSRLFRDYTTAIFDHDDTDAMLRSIRDFLRQLLLSCRDNIAIARLVFGEGAGSAGPYQEKCQAIIGHFIALIRDVLDQAAARQWITMQDTEMTAAMIFGLFQRCMFYYLLTKNEFDLDRFEQGMTDFLINGVGLREKF